MIRMKVGYGGGIKVWVRHVGGGGWCWRRRERARGSGVLSVFGGVRLKRLGREKKVMEI